MHTTTTQIPAAHIGDVIQDAYGNPAVVIGLTHAGTARDILQLVGSDRGRIASAGFRPGPAVTDPRQVAWARATARDLWPTLPANIRKTATVQSAR